MRTMGFGPDICLPGPSAWDRRRQPPYHCRQYKKTGKTYALPEDRCPSYGQTRPAHKKPLTLTPNDPLPTPPLPPAPPLLSTRHARRTAANTKKQARKLQTGPLSMFSATPGGATLLPAARHAMHPRRLPPYCTLPVPFSSGPPHAPPHPVKPLQPHPHDVALAADMHPVPIAWTTLHSLVVVHTIALARDTKALLQNLPAAALRPPHNSASHRVRSNVSATLRHIAATASGELRPPLLEARRQALRIREALQSAMAKPGNAFAMQRAWLDTHPLLKAAILHHSPLHLPLPTNLRRKHACNQPRHDTPICTAPCTPTTHPSPQAAPHPDQQEKLHCNWWHIAMDRRVGGATALP
jgi:hypothetical protein